MSRRLRRRIVAGGACGRPTVSAKSESGRAIDQKPDTARSANEPDLATLLHYIDKVDKAWWSVAATASRLWITQIILSVVLGLLSIGVVDVGEDITFSGVKFSVPFWVILVGGAFLSLCILVLGSRSLIRKEALTQELWSLYRRAGYEIELSGDSDRYPWSSSGPLEDVISGSDALSPHRWLRAFEGVTGFAVVGGLVILPFAAQISACLRTIHGLQGVWPWFVLLIPLATFFSVYSLLVRLVEDDDESEADDNESEADDDESEDEATAAAN